MEFILAAVLSAWGILLTLPSLAILLILSLIAAYNDNYKIAAGLTVVLTVALVAFAGVPWVWAAALYLPIGFIWSFWRWRVRGVEVADSLSNDTYYEKFARTWKDYSAMSLKEKQKVYDEEMELSKNVPRIISWCFSWPTSALERVIHDLVHVVKQLITGWFASIYTKISDSGRRRLVD